MYGISGWKKKKTEKNSSGQILVPAKHDWTNLLGTLLFLKASVAHSSKSSFLCSVVALSCDSAKVGDQQSERRSLRRWLTAKKCNWEFFTAANQSIPFSHEEAFKEKKGLHRFKKKTLLWTTVTLQFTWDQLDWKAAISLPLMQMNVKTAKGNGEWILNKCVRSTSDVYAHLAPSYMGLTFSQYTICYGACHISLAAFLKPVELHKTEWSHLKKNGNWKLENPKLV